MTHLTLWDQSLSNDETEIVLLEATTNSNMILSNYQATLCNQQLNSINFTRDVIVSSTSLELETRP